MTKIISSESQKLTNSQHIHLSSQALSIWHISCHNGSPLYSHIDISPYLVHFNQFSQRITAPTIDERRPAHINAYPKTADYVNTFTRSCVCILSHKIHYVNNGLYPPTMQQMISMKRFAYRAGRSWIDWVWAGYRAEAGKARRRRRRGERGEIASKPVGRDPPLNFLRPTNFFG